MSHTRRNFLKTAAAGASAAFIPFSLLTDDNFGIDEPPKDRLVVSHSSLDDAKQRLAESFTAFMDITGRRSVGSRQMIHLGKPATACYILDDTKVVYEDATFRVTGHFVARDSLFHVSRLSLQLFYKKSPFPDGESLVLRSFRELDTYLREGDTFNVQWDLLGDLADIAISGKSKWPEELNALTD